MSFKKNLDAWSVSEEDFPHSGTLADKLRFCLNYAVLAPSTYNTQPWYFEIEGNTVSMYADRRYALPVLDPHDRSMMMACASALFNLRLALRHFGLSEQTQLLPQSTHDDLLAWVQISENGSIAGEGDKKLFDAVIDRQMNKGAFKDVDVSRDILARLKSAAREEGAWLYVCEGDEHDVISHFIVEGDHIQMSNHMFRRELAAWTNERRYLSNDGMPAYANNFKDLMNKSAPHAARRFEIEPGKIATDEDLVNNCPVIAILGSEKGGDLSRLYAGQAYMRVLLQAEIEGLAVSTLNQPCEVPDLRLRLYDEIDHNLGRAQMVLRIGYSESQPLVRSPRRSIDVVSASVSDLRPKGMAANDVLGEKISTFQKIQNLFLAKRA